MRYMVDSPKWHYEGQDLCNFSEYGPSQFVTIRSHPTKIYKLKIMSMLNKKMILGTRKIF